MVEKNYWLGMAVMALVFGMTVVGCTSAPISYIKGRTGETTILLRQGLDAEQAFREANFIISKHGFEPEMMNTESGYIRTRWNYKWNDTGREVNNYRVRVIITFNPNRTQLVLSTPSELGVRRKWVAGFDTRAFEVLSADIMQSIGD